MQLIKSTVKIGLERPVKLLHVTDSHVALADERDDERKHALAKRMGDPDKEKYLYEHIAYAKEHGKGVRYLVDPQKKKEEKKLFL